MLFRSEAFWRAHQLPQPEPEHRFSQTRKWRFDYAWPDRFLALEVEGGIWVRGRHNHPSGFIKDLEKYNYAATAGWRILRVQPRELCTTGTAIMVGEALRVWNPLADLNSKLCQIKTP